MLRLRYLGLFIFFVSLFVGNLLVYSQNEIDIVPIAHGLNNPRGVAVLPDGGLAVVEAGIGRDVPLEVEGSGQISILDDLNHDGDYDDEGERLLLLTNQASYNSLTSFGTFHDEVFGLGDIVVLEDGRLFYTQDNPFAAPARNMPEDMEIYEGDTGVFELVDNQAKQVIERPATVNGMTYDPDAELFYIVESGYNQVTSFNLAGEEQVLAIFPVLGHYQQAVPAGLTYDPQSGDVLVALFSGFVHNYYGTELSYMPGDSQIVRLDPESRTWEAEITGLTTAIDVAVDEQGNIFVVELTREWPAPLMSLDFDLYNPDADPDPGGYPRFSGRVSMYPADGGEAVILADGLDTPTSITYADGRLFVSSGLGTPGRSVWSREGIHQIDGIIYTITGF